MTIITEAARGEQCTMNVAGVCNYSPETVVFIHFRWLGNCGTGIKPDDDQGCFACSACNKWTDSPDASQLTHTYESLRNWYGMRAMVRTRRRLRERGIVVVKRGKAA